MSYTTEQQQIEQVKKIAKEYALPVIVGIIIALLIVFGWRYYNNYQAERAERASLAYQELIIAVTNNKFDVVKKSADELTKNYASTPYATLAKFNLTKLAVKNNQLDEAAQHLSWIIKHTQVKEFAQIARIRLARIYIAQNKLPLALKELHAVKLPGFVGLASELEGDIYVRQKEIGKAKVAYQNALKVLTAADLSRPVLQMKLDNLND